MGGIKQEQSDASQQPKASHTADQPQEEVGTAAPDLQKLASESFLILLTC